MIAGPANRLVLALIDGCHIRPEGREERAHLFEFQLSVFKLSLADIKPYDASRILFHFISRKSLSANFIDHKTIQGLNIPTR
jgi:hypothetical protein